MVVLGSSGPQRADIQGLRAVAVVAVIIYHLSPYRLQGGYVGVDVFFVISGFLITSSLLRNPVHNFRDVLAFWGRRVRRLIPVATVALAITAVAAAIWMPYAAVASLGKDVIAAALYVVNWRLMTVQVTYFGTAPSAIQHYWSLSVEEQFYLLWPILLFLGAWLGWKRTKTPAKQGDEPSGVESQGVLAVIIAVCALSFAWSVVSTYINPNRAYFDSTTRIWELAIGGLLAALVAKNWFGAGSRQWLARASKWFRPLAIWLGVGLIAFSALWFNSATKFPGFPALVPTVGAALVIAADSGQTIPGRLLSIWPARWLGDRSYSIYVWHWPLIVIVPYIIGHPLMWKEKLVVLALTLLMSALSYQLLEQKLRFHPRFTSSLKATFVLLLACVTLAGATGAGTAVWASTTQRAADNKAAEQEAAQASADAASCVGAAVLRDPSCQDPGLLDDPNATMPDVLPASVRTCGNDPPFTTRNTCEFGSKSPTARIALIGNSHAGNWAPALLQSLPANNWQLTTFLKSYCYTVLEPIEFARYGMTEEDSVNCQATNQWMVSTIIADHFDLVVMTDLSSQSLVGVPDDDTQVVHQQTAYKEVLDAFTAAGLRVLVIRDTPLQQTDPTMCVAANKSNPALCATPSSQAIHPDPLANAAQADSTGLVSVLDLNPLLCQNDTCPVVIGGLIVYRNKDHLAPRFVRTLTPEIVTAVQNALTT